MKKINSYLACFIKGFYLLILLSGCANAFRPGLSPPKTITTSTTTPDHLAATATDRELATQTAIATPQASIEPTFTLDQRKKFVYQELQEVDDCRLPCWWDIQPGNSF